MLENCLRGKLGQQQLFCSYSLDFLLLLCEFSIVLDKVFSISGGKYIIEVDVRCDSGIDVSICCQNRSSPESPRVFLVRDGCVQIYTVRLLIF